MVATLYDEARARRTISPATRANGTVNGAAVDLGATGSESALVVVITGTVTDGTHTVAVEDSADGTSGWAAVPAGRLQGSPPAIVATDDDTQFEIGVVPIRQFLRVSVVTTGATTGGIVGAIVVAGQPGATPVSHA